MGTFTFWTFNFGIIKCHWFDYKVTQWGENQEKWCPNLWFLRPNLWVTTVNVCATHIMMEMILDFRHVFHMPVVCGAHMDPIWLGLDVGQILVLYPAEIGAPETPGVSHGTKIFGAKIFSYHPLMNLFYGFCGLVMLKIPKIKKNWSFSALSPITKEIC